MKPIENFTSVRVFIQARMSSNRFPGKVLAPLAGRPVIARVIEQVGQVFLPHEIVVLTSAEESDDPLAGYVRGLGINVFRGPLEDVFSRFQLCLKEYPCDWFCRISADSPLLDSKVFSKMLAFRDERMADLVTNVFPRTFPKGHSVEMVNAARFAALNAEQLTAEEKEHVTKYFYNHATQFSIINVESGDPARAQTSFTLDTLEDYRRLEILLNVELTSSQDEHGKR